jgi:hypothetical protein
VIKDGLRSTSGRLLPKGRKKSQKAISPGHRPGYTASTANALRSTFDRLLPKGRKKGQKHFAEVILLPFQGVSPPNNHSTQGDALG